MRTGKITTMLSFLCSLSTAAALASDAETSARATSGRSGAATATARYEGDRGFARTDTRSGAVNVARGVAVGVDRNGVSLSLSLAVAPVHGPAVATNLNMTIGRDGGSALSVGSAIAAGGDSRMVEAGGWTSANLAGAHATSLAAGRTDGGGIVRAATHSQSHELRPLLPRRVIRLR